MPHLPTPADAVQATASGLRPGRLLEDVCEEYLRAQLAGDRRAALIVLEEAQRSGATTWELQTGVVGEAQRRIGQLWMEGKLSVADEHQATAISQLGLAQLYYGAPVRPRNGLRLLFACVEGELHELPVRLVTDHLDLQGYDVRFLGANVPLQHLLRCIESERPDLLALSATMALTLPALKAAVAAVRAQHKALPIAAGGHALSSAPQLARELGIDLVAPDAATFHEGLRQLLKGRQ